MKNNRNMSDSLFTNLFIDEVNIQIIKLLNKDGRRSYASIANEIGIAPSTVQQRANALIEKGLLVIKGLVHPDDVGGFVMAMIALEADGSKLFQITNTLSKMPEVRWAVIVAGRFDILMEVVCNDNRHLLNFLGENLAKIDGVKNSETFPYLQVTKKTWDWPLFF
jgi:Lrp/AsnC family transcriptional regulator for asnA, asnC and gidA